MRMNNRWNEMTLGERIVLASWMAVREHLAADRDAITFERASHNAVRSPCLESTGRWTLNAGTSTFDPSEVEDETRSDGDVREGAD